MARLFAAVVPEGLRENKDLQVLLSKMKRTAFAKERDVRWTPPPLWHVTLTFLGELSNERKAKALEAFSEWNPQTTEIIIDLQGLGAFPRPDEARVLWIGVGATAELVRLHEDLSSHFERAGFVNEEREFLPHLTVARFRNLQSVTEYINLGRRKRFGSYPVRALTVFESVLQGNIPKYIPLATKTLA